MISSDYGTSGLKGALALAAAWLLDSVGYPESAAAALFCLMAADFALGFARAWKTGAFQSARLTRGAFKFFRCWLAVALFVWADEAMLAALPMLPVRLRDAFIAYLAVNEALSCADHLAFFGMPAPAPLLKRLRRYHGALQGGLESETAKAPGKGA